MALTSDSTMAARLVSIRYATPEVSFFEFDVMDSDGKEAAEPGAHIDVPVSEGVVRQYSLVTPLCKPSTFTIAVQRDDKGRGGSRRLHENSRVGQTFALGAPRNNFVLNENARRSVLIAGGIGVTPIYSMYKRLRELGRDVHLHYWSRTPQHALFREELEAQPDATMYYARSPTDTAQTLKEVLSAAGVEADLYCCGPTGMLDTFTQLTTHRPSEKVHVERFGAPTVPAVEGGDSCFAVSLAKSGRTIEVGASETILQALIREGVDASYSCEEGVCGACETKVLAGTPCHRDAVRIPEDHDRRKTIMICCSRSKQGSLTLDL
jgi:vanillate O-demethylase ferredoxin subunit